MKLLNKVFSGIKNDKPLDIQLNKAPDTKSTNYLNIVPMDGLSTGQTELTVTSQLITNSNLPDISENKSSNQQTQINMNTTLGNKLQPELRRNDNSTLPAANLVANLVSDNSKEIEQSFIDKYEILQKKLNVSEMYDIFNTLESISRTVTDLNQKNEKLDDFLEAWKPLLDNIHAFTQKKQNLQKIEQEMIQTISDLREIHQQMFDSISTVKEYHAEKEILYANRRKLADELEKKLLLLQDPKSTVK